MKKYILLGILAIFAFACEEGIDPISKVTPGQDETAPVVTIRYPGEGAQIRVREDITSIKIELDVKDDIEIGKVVLYLDNAKLKEYSDFKDYRHAAESFVYDQLTNGAHTIKVEASDLSGKTASATANFSKTAPYRPLYGEMFYMPFDGDYLELVSILEAGKTGSGAFADGKIGKAYAGAPDSYLTFKTADIVPALGSEFSAAFWYKLNTSPDRAGLLTISPTIDGDADRKDGIRLFREGSATSQTIKLNAGNGSADTWFDGGAAAAIASTAGWTHIAVSISTTEGVIYLNGEVVSRGAFSGVSWANCSWISIASGAPTFTVWNHLSDNSLYDELRLFNKALTQEEVRTLMNAQ
ncbi:hypothetical protein FACS189428_0400 [Clostridia bacterium]|nr:hypothetical protein FACS189428_0400 [Clostridia bacterium]